MARISVEVATALRNTAEALKKSEDYQWGHMGSCNCGFLAREITNLDKKEIHSRALQRYGDWNEQLNDYCPNSGFPMDDLISELTAFGFGLEDLKNLETLTDPEVLTRLQGDKRYLSHNIKSDVILYLETWSELIESKLLEKVSLDQIMKEQVQIESL